MMTSRPAPGVFLLLVAAMILLTSQSVSGHGRLVEPPSRSSMWHLGFRTPPNYDDNGLNCGGLNTQWYVNGGKCGVCGDPWNEPEPRPNEDGGRYGTGLITRTYTPGQTIDVTVEVTANHRGWFEFRLCAQNSPSTPVTQQCLDQHLLELADGSGTRYTLDPNAGLVQLKMKLPSGLTCTKCMIQWKWHAGNNHGGNDDIQEEFYGCSDVAIRDSGTGTVNPPTWQTTTPPTWHSTAPPTVGSMGQAWSPGSVCHGINAWQGQANLDQYCNDQCASGNCPLAYCTCLPTAPTTTGTPLPTTVTSPVASGECYGINAWHGNPSLDQYCKEQCPRGNCPSQSCACVAATTTTTTPGLLTCHATGQYFGYAVLDTWCTNTCASGVCPAECHCDTAIPTTTTPTPTTTTPTPTTTTTTTTPVPTTVTSPAASGECYGINAWHGNPSLDQYCKEQCPRGNCPSQSCACVAAPTTTTTITPGLLTCHATGQYYGSAVLDTWCTNTCAAGVCPAECHCDTITPTTTTTTTTTTSPAILQCHAQGSWAGNPNLELWCHETCPRYSCDPATCSCSPISTTPTPTANLQCYSMAGSSIMDLMCQAQCRGGLACPAQFCACGPRLTQVLTTTTQPTTTTQSSQACHAIGTWLGTAELDLWCVEHCAIGNCPPAYCRCHP